MGKLSKFKNYISMTKPVKVIKRFQKDEQGVTAVEFAFVGPPFFLLIFAIIESSMLFFANQYIETVVDDVARLYRTGRVISGISPSGQPEGIITEQGLRDEMCDRIVALFDCNRIFINLDSADRFIDLPLPPLADNSNNINAQGAFQPEERFEQNICPKQIIQLTATYEWPIYANYAAPLISDYAPADNPDQNAPQLENNNAVISATAVVRTEDFDQIDGTICP